MSEQESAATVAKRLEMQRKVAVRQIEWDALVRAVPYAVQCLTSILRTPVEEEQSR